MWLLGVGLMKRKRATMADLEARREHYIRMGLPQSAKSIDDKIAAMRQAGERLRKARQDKTEEYIK